MASIAWPTVTLTYANTSAGPMTSGDFTATLTDVSTYLIGFSTRRGRGNSLSHFDAGTMTLELDNRGGVWDPTNTASPLYPNLGPGRRFQLTADGYPLFTGYIDSLTPAYDYTGDERMIIVCTDMFKMLNLLTWVPAAFPVPEEATQARCQRVLTDMGFSSSWFATTTPPGNSTAAAIADTTFTSSALAHMQGVAEDTEAGLLFIDGSGLIRFYDRYTRPALTGATLLTLGDAGGSEVDYEPDIAPTFDDALLVNQAVVTDAAGLVSIASDAASITAYGPRNQQVSTLTATPNEAADLADYLVTTFKTVGLRFDQVRLRPVYTTQATWDPLLRIGADPGLAGDLAVATVTVKRRPPSGNVISQDCFVSRVAHDFNGNEWVMTWGLEPRVTGQTAAWLVLNDASLGKLGTGTLGF